MVLCQATKSWLKEIQTEFEFILFTYFIHLPSFLCHVVFSFYRVQNGCCSHPTPKPISAGISLPCGKAAIVWSGTLTLPGAQVDMLKFIRPHPPAFYGVNRFYHPPELLKILSSLTIQSAEASSVIWLIFRGWNSANKIAAFQQIKWKIMQNINV